MTYDIFINNILFTIIIMVRKKIEAAAFIYDFLKPIYYPIISYFYLIYYYAGRNGGENQNRRRRILGRRVRAIAAFCSAS